MPHAVLYRRLLLAGSIFVLGGCSMFGLGKTRSQPDTLLSGAQQVPPNASKASGSPDIRVAADRSVKGTLSLKGIAASSAHIHTGAAGIKGPAIITLEKVSESSYAVPRGALLSQAQYVAYRSGNLYLNVASSSFPEGEIRAQLRATD